MALDEASQPGPNGQLPCSAARPCRKPRATTEHDFAGHTLVVANKVAPYWPDTLLRTSARDPARARPLTSASARHRPTRPRLPRNAIFLSCLRRLLCLLSARRAGEAFAACRSPWPGHGGSRYDRCWPIPCAGPAIAVTGPAGRPDAATRPAGAVLAAAGHLWRRPGGGATLRRLPGAAAGRLPGHPQACGEGSRAGFGMVSGRGRGLRRGWRSWRRGWVLRR